MLSLERQAGRQAMYTKPIICVDLNYHWELKIENITPQGIRSPELRTPSTEHIHNILQQYVLFYTILFIQYCSFSNSQTLSEHLDAKQSRRLNRSHSFKFDEGVQIFVHFSRSKWQIERKTEKNGE